jgi:uncharacterized protein (TIRG00374 family)
MASASKPRLTKRIILFIAVGLATLLFYLLYFVGTMNIASVISQTDIACYASAFVAFLISVFFSSLTWRSLLESINVRISVRRALAFTWVGLFFDSVVPDPGWSGDLSKAYMLSKDLGEHGGRIAASVVGQKIIVMGVVVLDLFLGLVLLALNYTLPGNVILFIALVLGVTVASLIVLWYLSSKPKATKTLLDWFVRFLSFFLRGRWNSEDFRLRAENVLDQFHEGMRTLTAKPRALVQPVGFSLAAVVFDVSVVFLVFTSLKFPVSLDKILIVYALTGSLQAWGVSLLGFTEIIMSGAYMILGIPLTISLAATLLTRVITLWFKLVLSYFAFQWAGVHLILGQHPARSKDQPDKIQLETLDH